MNANKVLLPNDVRKLLNVDNKEIVELCKKTSVTPKKDHKGQIYFSIDEVKKLRNAKSSGIAIPTFIVFKKLIISISKLFLNNTREPASHNYCLSRILKIFRRLTKLILRNKNSSNLPDGAAFLQLFQYFA